MQTNKKDQTNHPELVLLTSLTAAEFMHLLSVFDPICQHYFQYYDLEGHPRRIPKYQEDARSSLPGSSSKLHFILMDLKENPRQHYHAQLFDMQQPRVSKWIKILLPLLQQALSRLQVLPKRFGYELYAFLQTFTRYVLLMDATERPIPRSIDDERQKHEYSGKKKAHTVKNNLIVDQRSHILFLSSTYPGSVHDKKLAQEAGHQFPDNTIVIEDLGYTGYEPENTAVIRPHKKYKNGQLTQQQKQDNKRISQMRVPVEHVMAGVKRLNIVKEKIRLRWQDAQDHIMLIACGLHNLRNA
jgi:hypothetical protein